MSVYIMLWEFNVSIYLCYGSLMSVYIMLWEFNVSIYYVMGV